MVAARRCGPLRRLNLLELRRVLPGVLPASILLMCLAGAVSTAPLAPPFTQHSMVAGPLRLRGGIMWVGGGRQFNRTVDPDAGPEAAVDTFEPLRVRAEAHNRIKALKSRQGAKFQSSEVPPRSTLSTAVTMVDSGRLTEAGVYPASAEHVARYSIKNMQEMPGRGRNYASPNGVIC